MNTVERLKQLLKERNWTEYRLAKEGGLSMSTLQNIYKRNTIPTIDTLERICTAFGITLSQFFAEGEIVDLSPELKRLFDGWVNLTLEQKQAVQTIINAFNHDK
ncbi:MAG: helix-turn-helix transcriptional regulator [Clostridia bacterium]|nr:helix-turn-helix transcriptional regulator [Clostridia bacterium]